MPASAAAQLALLRTTAGIELAILNEEFWLHGAALNPELDHQLRCLTGAERFVVLADQQLAPVGCLVPTATLPAGPWIKIHDWLSLALPTAGYAARVLEQLPLQLVRSYCEIASTGLLTKLDALLGYAANAQAARLENCRFVAADHGRVFVIGDRLPAVEGHNFYERQRIWIPAGWTWTPALDVEVLHELLKLEPREHLLWETDQALHRLHEDDFVKASRAALRTTAAALSMTTSSPGAP